MPVLDCHARPTGSYTPAAAIGPSVCLLASGSRLLAAIALIVGSVGVANAIPEWRRIRPRAGATEVLGRAPHVSPVGDRCRDILDHRRQRRPPHHDHHRRAGATASAPGPLAQPTPATPVTFSETTPDLDRVVTTDKVIFLGIDDGLVRDPAVLALLRKERVPAHAVPRAPARAGRSGVLPRDCSRWARPSRPTRSTTRSSPPSDGAHQTHEICGDLNDLTSWFGARPTLFRPPYGEWNETTRSVVARLWAAGPSCSGAAPPTTAGSISSAVRTSIPATSSSCTSATDLSAEPRAGLRQGAERGLPDRPARGLPRHRAAPPHVPARRAGGAAPPDTEIGCGK